MLSYLQSLCLPRNDPSNPLFAVLPNPHIVLLILYQYLYPVVRVAREFDSTLGMISPNMSARELDLGVILSERTRS